MADMREVPLQAIPQWGRAGDSILAAHCGAIDYRSASVPSKPRGKTAEIPRFENNEEAWKAIIRRRVVAGQQIVLVGFHLLDWFPRAPGLYHTGNAEFARQEALCHLHRGMRNSPIRARDHARRDRNANDYTVVFTPQGKLSMLQGGVGCIRLKPIRISGEDHWLISATSDGIAHAGIPIAVPASLYYELLDEIGERGSHRSDVSGRLVFVDDTISRLFDSYMNVPRLYLQVTDLKPRRPKKVELEISVAVSFLSQFEGRTKAYATYVTFEPNIDGSFDDAVSWMKREYVEGEYDGRIITDFDQTQTIFPEARLALSDVMDGLVSRGALRNTIELLHATASVDDYLNEVEKRKLYFGRANAKKTKIFVSYARKPNKETRWMEQITARLRKEIGGPRNTIWNDGEIQAGDRGYDEIEDAIARTKVAILILTPEFLASDFIRDVELPKFLDYAEAGSLALLCVYGSKIDRRGLPGRLRQYQFVNSLDEPLSEMTSQQRDALYSKLVRRAAEEMKKV